MGIPNSKYGIWRYFDILYFQAKSHANPQVKSKKNQCYTSVKSSGHGESKTLNFDEFWQHILPCKILG